MSPRNEILLVKKENDELANAKWCCPGDWIPSGSEPGKELKRTVKKGLHMEISFDKNGRYPIFDFDNNIEVILYNAHPKEDILMPEGDVWSAGWFTRDEVKWHWKNLDDETKILLKTAGFLEIQ